MGNVHLPGGDRGSVPVSANPHECNPVHFIRKDVVYFNQESSVRYLEYSIEHREDGLTAVVVAGYGVTPGNVPDRVLGEESADCRYVPASKTRIKLSEESRVWVIARGSTSAPPSRPVTLALNASGFELCGCRNLHGAEHRSSVRPLPGEGS